MPEFRTRFVDDRIQMVPARELRLNPKNWRQHPDGQRSALRAMLERVGYVDALLVRRDSDGLLHLIDGELRTKIADDAEVPVIELDLDDDETDDVLLTFDAISAQAEANPEMLEELMATTTLASNADLKSLWSELNNEITFERDVTEGFDDTIDEDEIDDGKDADPVVQMRVSVQQSNVETARVIIADGLTEAGIEFQIASIGT